MQSLYIICGVPGSGKTWVCTQLQNRFAYIKHDDYVNNRIGFIQALVHALETSEIPVVTECPFKISEVTEGLTTLNIKPILYLINESEDTISNRYRTRENKIIPKQHLTNAKRYAEDKNRWAFIGTSEEVLNKLSEV